jgi:hypothetical protein
MIGRPRCGVLAWIWLSGLCLLCLLFDPITEHLVPWPALDTRSMQFEVVALIVALPLLLGCVGGYCRNPWVTLCGVPAILVCRQMSEVLSHRQPAGVGCPGDPLFLLLLGLMFLVSGVTHWGVASSLRPRYPAGHCQQCGYNLTGNVSGRCPECGCSVDGQPRP